VSCFFSFLCFLFQTLLFSLSFSYLGSLERSGVGIGGGVYTSIGGRGRGEGGGGVGHRFAGLVFFGKCGERGYGFFVPMLGCESECPPLLLGLVPGRLFCCSWSCM